MTLKSWSRRSVLACAVIRLAAGAVVFAQEPASLPQPAPPAPGKSPAVALIDAADAAQWQAWVKEKGWQVITAPIANTAIDPRVQALAAAVRDAIQKGAADPAQIYLAGRGEASAAVFYTISRVPDLWAAAIAVGGSPQPAIDSDRIFTANFALVPVLWLTASNEDEALAKKLKSEALNVEWRSSAGATNGAIFDWLAHHRRDEFPNEIDCETNSPTFASCYWIQLTKFDVNERNDVLPSTRLKAIATASLDLGGFGYKPGDPGPGILVSYLPDKYNGELKLGDRIVAIDGRPIEDGRKYAEIMAKATEGHAVAMVQRGKERIRMETRIILPRRDPVVTARVEAQYLPGDKEIQIVSRTIQEMRLTIPPHWAPDSKLFWNGLALDHSELSGCLVLTIDKELLHAVKCP